MTVFTICLLTICWLSASIVVYVYFGYPALLWILSRAKRIEQVPTVDSYEPMVSLIISALNEEQVIAQKLENSLALDYPREKLEIIVASSCCADRTDQIVQSFARKGVHLHPIGEPGKTVAQNVTVPLVKGEIVVFSDANSIYEKGAIRKLVRNFASQVVGLVQGRLKYEEVDSSSVGKGEDFYWKYEDFIKKAESKLGSCIAANGGILAIRKELYEPLAPFVYEDFALPALTLAKRHLSLFETAAVAREKVSQKTETEFWRKVRIVTGDASSFRIVLLWLLKSFRWFPALQLTSHKLLRWLVPFFLLAIFVTTLLLARNPFYSWILAVQLVFYLVALAVHFWGERRTGLLCIPFYFCMVNLAAAVGVLRAIFGVKVLTWSKKTTTR